MIYITGDTHGLIDFPKLKHYFKHRYVSRHDVLIILGDAGMVWSEEDCCIQDYEYLGPTVLFIDGNHENFDLLEQFPIVERFDAKVHYLDRDVFHVLRGEILRINGLSFLCLGGATSIDKEYRIPGISWWEEEHIRDKDVTRAIENVKNQGGGVDYVLTHCAPSRIVKSMFGFSSDSDSEQLSLLQESIGFSHWFFGHYHFDRSRGKFRCFYNDVLEIPALQKGKRPLSMHLLTGGSDGSFLRNCKTGRTLKLTSIDLPEWYYAEYSNIHYDLSGVKDVAYKRPYFDNHIDKDASLYLAYDGVHPKNKDHSPKNEDDYEINTWRVHLVRVILGLEKYSPGLNLNGVKAQINLTYDQYNNGSIASYDHEVPCRPYPEVKTPRYVSRHEKETAMYAVYHGDRILSTFIHVERANAYAETYITGNLRMELPPCFEQETPYFRQYPIGTGEVTVKAID